MRSIKIYLSKFVPITLKYLCISADNICFDLVYDRDHHEHDRSIIIVNIKSTMTI